MEKQKTIFGTFKSPSSHPNDLITCDDGQEHPRWSVWPDCKGEHHIYACDRDVVDTEAVENLVLELYFTSEEHYEASQEFSDELREQFAGQNLAWRKEVTEWVKRELEGWEVLDKVLPPDHLASKVVDIINPVINTDAIQNSSDSREYAEDGILVWSMKIGEVEQRIEVSNHSVLLALHEQDRLDDVLDRADCEGVVNRSLYGGDRKTYKVPLEVNSPSLTITFRHSGGWDFVFSDDCLRQKLAECVLVYHGYESEPPEVNNGKGSDANQVPG